MDTLVLNGDHQPLIYLPLSVIPWKQAVKLMFLERVNVLESYEDWDIHSPNLTMPVPAVIVTKEFFNFRKKVKFKRHNMYLRDLYQCQYCADTFSYNELTIDHVIPLSRGGKTSWNNCVTACKDCNTKKGNGLMSPIREPFEPDYFHLVGQRKTQPFAIKHKSWVTYLPISKAA